jgi:hypothetical protein
MKKYILLIAIISALFLGWSQTRNVNEAPPLSTSGDEIVATAFREQQSGIQVIGEGVVIKVLPDDTRGSAHQRFIIRLESGQTLLVSHNIDIAPRIRSLQPGDSVAFNGVYEWNSEGGIIHWTHHDPDGRHEDGWLQHEGEIFQ